MTGHSQTEAARDVVRLDNVAKRYQRGDEVVSALDGVSLTLAAGEIVALVGPSGCGKSTTLNLVSGVDLADSGRVEVCGVDLGAVGEEGLMTLRRRKIGIVFQAFHLMPHLTVEENVALPLALDGRRDPARVRELLSRVGLDAPAPTLPVRAVGRRAAANRGRARPSPPAAGAGRGRADREPRLRTPARPSCACSTSCGGRRGRRCCWPPTTSTWPRPPDRVVTMRDGRLVSTWSSGPWCCGPSCAGPCASWRPWPGSRPGSPSVVATVVGEPGRGGLLRARGWWRSRVGCASR